MPDHLKHMPYAQRWHNLLYQIAELKQTNRHWQSVWQNHSIDKNLAIWSLTETNQSFHLQHKFVETVVNCQNPQSSSHCRPPRQSDQLTHRPHQERCAHHTWLAKQLPDQTIQSVRQSDFAWSSNRDQVENF